VKKKPSTDEAPAKASSKINPALEPLARPTASLRLDERNARKHERRSIDTIKTSLSTYGQQKPIVALTSGTVIAGNGTLEAARELGWDRLAVVTFDNEDEARARAFAIMDNRSAELSTWDDDLLRDTIRSLDDSMRDVIGFSSKDIDKMMKEIIAKDDVIEDDGEVAFIDSQSGQSYMLGDHILICGDSRSDDTWSAIKQIEGRKSVITSPPYGTNVNLRGHLAENAGESFYVDDESVDEWPSLMHDFTSKALDACDQAVINVQMLASNKRSLVEWMFKFCNRLVDVAVWNKVIAAPALAPKVMDSKFEFVFILSKEMNPTRSIPMSDGWRGEFRNVVEVNHEMNAFADHHRAVFPMSLAKHLVAMTTTKNDVVVDPFCGTGTTIIASHELGRRCVGVELLPKYCDIIRRRWTRYADENGIEAGSGALR
jgi:hypothetical protein